jgi:hypothetical protein
MGQCSDRARTVIDDDPFRANQTLSTQLRLATERIEQLEQQVIDYREMFLQERAAKEKAEKRIAEWETGLYALFPEDDV